MKKIKTKILSALLALALIQCNIANAIIPSVEGAVNIISEQDSFVLFWDKVYKDDWEPIEDYEILMSDHSVRDWEYYDEFVRVRYSENWVKVLNYWKRPFEELKKYYFSIIAVNSVEKSEYYSTELIWNLWNNIWDSMTDWQIINEISTIESINNEVDKNYNIAEDSDWASDLSPEDWNIIAVWSQTWELTENLIANQDDMQFTWSTIDSMPWNIVDENIYNDTTEAIWLDPEKGYTWSIVADSWVDNTINNDLNNQVLDSWSLIVDNNQNSQISDLEDLPVENDINNQEADSGAILANKEIEDLWAKYDSLYWDQDWNIAQNEDENLKASAEKDIQSNLPNIDKEQNQDQEILNEHSSANIDIVVPKYNKENILIITVWAICSVVILLLLIWWILCLINKKNPIENNELSNNLNSDLPENLDKVTADNENIAESSDTVASEESDITKDPSLVAPVDPSNTESAENIFSGNETVVLPENNLSTESIDSNNELVKEDPILSEDSNLNQEIKNTNSVCNISDNASGVIENDISVTGEEKAKSSIQNLKDKCIGFISSIKQKTMNLFSRSNKATLTS